jgi:hypothetical protein
MVSTIQITFAQYEFQDMLLGISEKNHSAHDDAYNNGLIHSCMSC